MADRDETGSGPDEETHRRRERKRDDGDRGRASGNRDSRDGTHDDLERARDDLKRVRDDLDRAREDLARARGDRGQGKESRKQPDPREEDRQRSDQDEQSDPERNGSRANQHQDDDREQHPPMDRERQDSLRRKFRRYALIVCLIAVALAVWGIVSRLVARSDLRKTTTAEAVPTVVTAKPQWSGAGDELVLPGIVQAYIESPIYARTSGYLKSWRTDIGAKVHKGDLLAEIETPEVDKQLAQARADLATAQANLAISVITNQRWQGLLKTQAVSVQDADNRAADAAAKKSTVDSAEQNVARLRDLEAFKRVIAPFDGVITARNTDVGYLINAGQSPGTELFRLADIRRLRIYAQVPEAYAAATAAGLKAELHFAERPGVTYAADTIRTSQSLDPTARTLQVELQLDNRESQLFPGSYTEIHFKLPSSNQTLRLPANTVLFRGKNQQVAVVDRDHKIELKDIDEGRDFGKTIEVLHGLDPDDAVVVNPPDSLESGVKVRIAPPPSNQGQASPAS